MATCEFCSAPLPKNSNICLYCNERNDIDLRGEKQRVNLRPNERRDCPVCNIPLTTVNVGVKTALFIESCESCYGLFFDNLELEELIKSRVKPSSNINYKKILDLNNNPRYVDIVTYRHCPVCKGVMNRVNYDKRSGVIMDVCKQHGIWLDPGELTHILEYSYLSNTMPKTEHSTHNTLKKETRYTEKSKETGNYLLDILWDILSA